MKSPKRVATSLFAAVLGGVLVAASLTSTEAARPVDKKTTLANITRLTTSILGSSQFSHHPLDDQLAGKLLERYLEALDGSRSLFFQSDVDELAAYRATLARDTRVDGSTRAAREIFARYLRRLEQEVAYDTGLLAAGDFDFSSDDVYTFDRKRAPRPRDDAAARALWRQELRAEYLSEKLADEAPSAKQITEKLTRRHARHLRTMKALGENEVVEVYLDALTHVYDPHSDYLGHEEMESLSIAMSLSLFGVGATLKSEDGVCTIESLVPGSPAAKGGELKPGDRIIAVAQGTGEAVDVTDMPLGRIVELIRGKKGSTVRLTVLPPVGSPGASRTVQVVRDEVKLEDQQAKARIVDLPRAGAASVRLGVVDLPSFYAGGPRGGATADVMALLGKLSAEHVRGVVLDLRRNGGGSLDEAIRLTGLFVESGPIVQTRDVKGAIEVAKDPDIRVAYAGPLIVLTSRFSASASEIAAGALQDYGRAPIVGDSATFGKGTVQTVTPLAPIMERLGLEHGFDPGGLKVTVAKFYRPNGASTELRGVASDVVLPSPSDVAGISESTLSDPLPWDSVAPAKHQREDRVRPYVGALREASERRMRDDRAFSILRDEVALLKKRVTAGTISLNEKERRRELEGSKTREDEMEREARRLESTFTMYPITVASTARAGLPPAAKPRPAATANAKSAARGPLRRGDGDETTPFEDVLANEALLILRDYVGLLSAPARGAELAPDRAPAKP